MKFAVSQAISIVLALLCIAAAPSDRVVVMISLDGLAGYYMDDPKAEMPTLRLLAKEGARASGMKASTPTVTWPNHATLMTGCEPARHGVVGNNFLDRVTGKHVVLISDPVFDQAEIVKVPTIYDAAKRAGLSTCAIRWPATRNGQALDWTIPDINDWQLATKYITPGLLDEFTAADIDIEAAVKNKRRKGQKVADGEDPPRDEVFANAFKLVLEKHKPQVSLLHLADIDHQEHAHGPKSPQAYEAIKTADGLVKEIRDQLQKQFPDRWTLVIVSDHGFSPIERVLYPNVLLRKAGLIEVKGPRVVSDNIRFVFQGGAAMVYLDAPDDAARDALAEKITRALDGADGYGKIIPPSQLSTVGVADPKVDPHAPDMILFAKMGHVFGDTAAGDLPFREKPERLGSHGHDATYPELHATFIASGAGIKAGVNLGEISNIDVAPTLAALLGIDLPNTDGKPLTAALAHPAEGR